MNRQQTDCHTECGDCEEGFSAPFIGKGFVERCEKTQNVGENTDARVESKTVFIGVIFPHKRVVDEEFRHEGGLDSDGQIACDLVKDVDDCDEHQKNKKIFASRTAVMHFSKTFKLTFFFFQNFFGRYHGCHLLCGVYIVYFVIIA